MGTRTRGRRFSGTEKADGPENPDNEDMEDNTEIDIVNMMHEKKEIEEKSSCRHRQCWAQKKSAFT